jgi:hypothetical protein
MPLRILKYDPSTVSFVPLQQLDFFKEFDGLQDVRSFKGLQGV